MSVDRILHRRTKVVAFTLVLLFSITSGLLLFGTAHAIDYQKYPEALKLVDEIVEEHGIDRAWATSIISNAEYRQEVIDAMTRPAEKKFPWYRYRKIFVTENNAEAGARFWSRYRDVIERAEQQYGVDGEYIVAIIGVETRYGEVTGRHRIIDSLLTLTLGYPKRSDFFKKELIEFMKLTKAEDISPYHAKGSYAGAMGIPQFISSSYSNYSVDFNNNGKRDLFREPEDAIGSVANYLKLHGWELNAPVYVDFSVEDATAVAPLQTKNLSTNTTFEELKKAGASLQSEFEVAEDQDMGLAILEVSETDNLYRGSFPNFYVITTYNRSTLYASAVAELAQSIAKVFKKG